MLVHPADKENKNKTQALSIRDSSTECIADSFCDIKPPSQASIFIK